jgi:hypothetical protein
MGGRSALVGIALALLASATAGVAQARERADHSRWQRELGRQAVVDLDPATGTPRVLARLDGALTRASSRTPRDIATAYVRENLAALGLTAGDVAGTPVVEPQPGGVTSVQWRQTVDGIPAADHALRVNVGRDGRVLNLLGSPAHGLSVSTTTPSIDAGEALRAVQDAVGVHRSLVRRGAPRGVRRTTSYGDDTEASLVTFDGRLAWRVQYRADDEAVYDATVDARTGTVLRSANMVKRDAVASVWERFPGNGPGGTPASVDLEAEGWLPAGASVLDGPNAHAYSDLDDNDAAAASEEVGRTGGGFSHALRPVGGPGCDAAHLCSWSAADRTRNREQDAVQAFYFANRFHDHLRDLGFTAAKGAFEGADDLLLETMDGADSGPDGDHANNANMFTPRDGSHPRMQMYLWNGSFRNISSGSDAAILYHEYTHGLSNRLVHDADGYGALNSAQAGAMGEGWSDFYAQDFLVDQYPDLDTSAVGEVSMGAYTDYPGGGKLRYSPLDCPPVGADPVACPGRFTVGSGGFTYGDFGRIAGGAEVHADGEIWAQTLWDVRTAVGPEKARALVTTGMSLLAPEPSFLDARNAILLADQTLYEGAGAAALWDVFAARGMGFYAAAINGDDPAPAQSFAPPPAAGGARGTLRGRVTNAIGGAGVAGVPVGLSGLGTVSTVTGADGRYTIADVPAGDYKKITAGGDGWEGPTRELTVTAGATSTFDAVVRRDWAAAKGGARISTSTGREYSNYGCGPNAAIDGSRELGWSTASTSAKNLVVRLPAAIEVAQFAIDPTETCGDDAASATAGYRIETSPDERTWTVAAAGTFTSANRDTLNLLTPSAGATNVRYVRLTLLSSQGSSSFRDLSELAIYGTTPAPDTTIVSGPSPFVFTSDDPAATFECKIDDGEYDDCTSPFTPPVGRHTFAVRARDAAGTVDPTPATSQYDTTPADTTLEPGGPPFTFSATPAGLTFECSLDHGEFAACTSPHDPGELPEGEHTFEVRAAGDPTPASRTFIVDRTPPETTIDSGPSPLRFSADEPGSTFECKIDDGAFEACTSPKTVMWPEGSHVFAVRATDTAGNIDPTPAELTFTVDRTGPAITGVTGPPELSNDATPTFGFEAGEAGASFECRLDAPGHPGAFEPCEPPKTYDRLTEDATYTFTVRARDAAGNLGGEVSRSFRLDTTPPTTTFDATPPAIVHAGPLAFAVRATDGEIACALDDGDYGSCATIIRAETLTLGEHVFRARAEDAAGNIEAPAAEFRFTVVNAAPTASLRLDPTSGPAPLIARPTIGGADPDGDALSYTLDFGDGQVVRGRLPVALVGHRYEVPGTYTVRVTVSDGRAEAQAEQSVVAGAPQGATPPALTLTLSAAAVGLGTFVPGVARDYTASLTATTTGGGLLTVRDPGANAGHLVGPAGALAQPLAVKGVDGAFAPLTSAVAVPDAIEFRQPIGADEVLTSGAYAKALTFTLAVTTP